MKAEIAQALTPLLSRVRTDARGVKKHGGKPYKENKPLDTKALPRHANGGPALGAYPIKPGESMCMVAVFDLDSHKGESPWDRMAEVALDICTELDKHGLVPHPWRSSGGKGIHHPDDLGVAPGSRSVRALLKDRARPLGFKDGAGGVAEGEIEIFPKQDRVHPGQYGVVLLPAGGFRVGAAGRLHLRALGQGSHRRLRLDRLGRLCPWPRHRMRRPCIANVDVDIDEVASAVAAIPNSGTVRLRHVVQGRGRHPRLRRRGDRPRDRRGVVRTIE